MSIFVRNPTHLDIGLQLVIRINTIKLRCEREVGLRCSRVVVSIHVMIKNTKNALIKIKKVQKDSSRLIFRSFYFQLHSISLNYLRKHELINFISRKINTRTGFVPVLTGVT